MQKRRASHSSIAPSSSVTYLNIKLPCSPAAGRRNRFEHNAISSCKRIADAQSRSLQGGGAPVAPCLIETAEAGFHEPFVQAWRDVTLCHGLPVQAIVACRKYKSNLNRWLLCHHHHSDTHHHYFSPNHPSQTPSYHSQWPLSAVSASFVYQPTSWSSLSKIAQFLRVLIATSSIASMANIRGVRPSPR